MLFFKVCLLVCISAFVATQRIDGQFWPCNPTKNATGKCTPNKGLTGSSYSVDFTKQTSIPDGWTLSNYAQVNFGNKGAEFTFKKRGDAPQLWTNFFMLGCRYEIVAQVAPGIGMISSSVLISDDFDEIDFEFSGNNFGFTGTSGVGQNNYFGKGVTGSYDRGQWFSVDQPMSQFHTYSIDWNSERIIWAVDGRVLRTLYRKDGDKDSHQYPQSPSRLQIGIWDGGDPDGNSGTVNWAGGYTDLTKAPYTMYVKSINIVNYMPACAYNWTDQSGNWESIKVITDQNVCNSVYGSSSTSSVATRTLSTASIVQSVAAFSTTSTIKRTTTASSSASTAALYTASTVQTTTVASSPASAAALSTTSAVKTTSASSYLGSTMISTSLASTASSANSMAVTTSQSVAVVGTQATDTRSQQAKSVAATSSKNTTIISVLTSNNMVEKTSNILVSSPKPSQTVTTIVTVHITTTSYYFVASSLSMSSSSIADAMGQAAPSTAVSHSSPAVSILSSAPLASSASLPSSTAPKSSAYGTSMLPSSPATSISQVAVSYSVSLASSKPFASSALLQLSTAASSSVPAKNEVAPPLLASSSSSSVAGVPSPFSSGASRSYMSPSMTTPLGTASTTTREAAELRTLSNLQILIGLIQKILALILGRKSELGSLSRTTAADVASTSNSIGSVQSEVVEVLKKFTPRGRQLQKHRREVHHRMV